MSVNLLKLALGLTLPHVALQQPGRFI